MRTATVRTEHDHPAVIAAALRPDNSADMATTTDGTAVETTIERDATGSLRATVDDYLVNVTVARSVTALARSAPTPETAGEGDTVTTDSNDFSATDRQ